MFDKVTGDYVGRYAGGLSYLDSVDHVGLSGAAVSGCEKKVEGGICPMPRR